MPLTPSVSTETHPEDHLTGADANVEFADWLVHARSGDGVALGWAVTALFYAALHESRAYLAAKHNHRIASHEDMRAVWRVHPEMNSAKAPYIELKQQSESARYYLNRAFTPDDVLFLKQRYSRVRSMFRSKTERALEASKPR